MLILSRKKRTFDVFYQIFRMNDKNFQKGNKTRVKKCSSLLRKKKKNKKLNNPSSL